MHPLSLPDCIHTLPRLRHRSGKFMPRNQRMPMRTGPADPRQIRTADAGSLYPDQYLLLTRHRFLHCLIAQIICAVQNPCFHLVFLPFL